MTNELLRAHAEQIAASCVPLPEGITPTNVSALISEQIDQAQISEDYRPIISDLAFEAVVDSNRASRFQSFISKL